MIRTFAALQAIDPGFNPHHLLSMVVSTAGAKEANSARAEFFEACHRTSKKDSEIAYWEETVDLLAARLEDHCHAHDCRTGSVAAERVRRAFA